MSTVQETATDRFVIRAANEHEYDAVGRLTYEAFGHHKPGASQPDPERLRLLTDAAARAQSGVLLVVEDTHSGAVVGTASVFNAESELSRQARPGEIELRLLAVHEDARRHRLGWRLLEAAAQLGRAQGASRLVLDTAAFNTGSQALYERFGFERLPERDLLRATPKTPLLVYGYQL